MKQLITIGNTSIGENYPCFIIAEAGVNHNGDLDLAKQLIIAAKQAGADCVKFQTFKAENIVLEIAPKADYQLHTTDPEESQFDMLKKLEMDFDNFAEMMRCCEENEILFLSTPYNKADVDLLDNLGVKAFKLASMHLVEPHFLQYVARKGKPLILSTGMSTMADIDEALRAIRETGNDQIITLQCTTNYPSKLEDANLLAMQSFMDVFGCEVGYSDHTQGNTACVVATGLGARVIEKHFTLDRSLPGPDQSSSSTPAEFTELVKVIREAEMVRGTSYKEPSPIEVTNARGMRRSIVAERIIPVGTIITEEMLAFKRPATGIPVKNIDLILGKRARNDIPENSQLKWSDLSENV